jgi:hypothetical protein
MGRTRYSRMRRTDALGGTDAVKHFYYKYAACDQRSRLSIVITDQNGKG